GRVGHPSEMFNIGDEITVKVLNFDRERERVSLGLKQLKEDPWLNAAERYPVGTRITGRVVSLADYGAFVEVEEGIEGLIHVSEMSWTRKVRHPSKIVNVGDMVEAVVLSISPDQKRISLGMKQVEPNPWDVIAEKYPVGTTIEGRIKNITDFGLFIELEEGVEGLVHVSEISEEKIKTPVGMFNVDDVIEAKVVSVNRRERKIGLSMRRLDEEAERQVYSEYVNSTQAATSNLGALLKEGLAQKEDEENGSESDEDK
ncbi:MAG: S1 RNA-binding domain-containing protein, partial [Deltaproteobacteria bacterium]|nr:S1 RNA-binding domain-containing protein [Deltaproteobacteria bacterium]